MPQPVKLILMTSYTAGQRECDTLSGFKRQFDFFFLRKYVSSYCWVDEDSGTSVPCVSGEHDAVTKQQKSLA